MPISPEAIERFLARDIPELPPFKGVAPRALLERISSSVGAPYAPIGHTPRPAQLEGLAAALWLRRGLLFYGMRMGKTKIGLDWARMLREAGLWRNKGLIVAHAPAGTTVWEESALTESNQRVRGVRAGPRAMDQLMKLLQDKRTDLVVMSWSVLQELFSTTKQVARGARKGQNKDYADHKLLRQIAPYFGLVIFDEIHTCKNYAGLRFAIAQDLIGSCDYRLGLTGTPIGRNPMHLWAQVFLIDEGELLGRSYRFFEAAFGKKKQIYRRAGARPVDTFVFDKKKMPLLRDWLSTISISYERSETTEENVVAAEVPVGMSKAQARAYDEQLERARLIREDDTRAQENIFIRLRQITAGHLPFSNEEGEKRLLRFRDAGKMVWLRDFLDEYDGSFQMLIFHEFIPTGRYICEELAQRDIAHRWLWGGSKDRDGIIKAFQRGEARVMVANSAAGAMAIDLPQADYLLFYDSPTSPITRAQAEARPMSRGERPLYMDDLVGSPADERVLGFVRQGKGTLRQVLGRDAASFYKLLKRR